MAETNELDSTCGISDEELTERFRAAIRIDNEGGSRALRSPDTKTRQSGPILSIRTGGANMSEHSKRLSEVMFFAGPNGSGKSTITGMAKIVGQYINADDIKRASLCTDLEAAQKAEQLRREMLNGGRDFTFETVLSTDRNLKLLHLRTVSSYRR